MHDYPSEKYGWYGDKANRDAAMGYPDFDVKDPPEMKDEAPIDKNAKV